MKKPIFIFGIALPVVTVILDQLSKYWAVKKFDVPMNICEIDPYVSANIDLTPIFDLTLLCNQGISWGLLQGDSSLKRWALTIFAFVMCIVLFFVLAKAKDNLTRLSLGLVIGGAIGNGIDRALFGAVTDFINVTDIVPFFHWIFNVADSAITVGVIGLLLASFLIKPDETPKKKPG